MATTNTNGRLPKKICKDCPPELKGKRPANYPGPRCATCSRVHRKAGTVRRYETRLREVYGLTLAEYQAIKTHQGGGCICGPWTGYNGATRALSVDHDHKTGFVRGVLCKHCNDLLGRVRDDPTYFVEMWRYLTSPPARHVLGENRIAPGAPRANPVLS